MQNETANSTVHLNGEQAKQELTALAQKAQNLRMRLVEANEAGDGKAFEKLTKELTATNKQMKQMAKEAFDVKKVLDNLSGASMPDLVKAKKEIDKQLSSPSIARNSKEWKELQAQLRSVKTEMSAISNESKVTESAFTKLANFTNKSWQMFAAGAAALLGVVLGLKSAAMEAARMSDVYGQVQKYTGESAAGVAGLNDELKKMDTRTARDELNRLMGEAGKLGVEGKDNLLQFAKAADIIQVSLGDDLGADAVKNIGKLTYMFGVQEKMGMEKSMLAVGSAINEVGQKSTASEAYLLEFTNRLSGMGVAAGMTIPQIIGFGSVLDQNAQQVEMSATAMNKFIGTLATKSESIAKAIGIPASKLKKAVGEDMNAALLMVFEQLNKKGGLIDLAPLFSDLGADGARAASVITILASKYKSLGTEQSLALKSFNAGTSVVKEFEIQNNTMQAKVDKSKKAFLDASETLGKSLSPAFLHSTNAAVYMIKALSQLPMWLKENRGLLLTLATTMTIYAIAVNRAWIATQAQMVLEKLKVAWTAATTAATLAQVAVTGYLTGATRVANLATKEFFATLGLNPFIAVGVAIAAIVIALYKWREANEENKKATQIYKEIMDDQTQLLEQNSKALLQNKSELEGLVVAITNTNNNEATRSRLIDELNKKFPGFISFIDKEKVSNELLKAALADVNEQYDLRLQNVALSAKSQSFENAAVKAMTRQLEIQEKLKELRADGTNDHDKEIKKLEAEDAKLNADIKNYKAKATELKTKVVDNNSQSDEMNTPAYYESQMRIWKSTMKDISEKRRNAIADGNSEQSEFYNNQIVQANAAFKYANLKFNELSKKPKPTNVPKGTPTDPTDKEIKAQQQKELDAIDKWLAEEQIKLKKRHETNLDSEEVYAKKMVNLNEKALGKKRDVYKKSDKEYLDYQNQIEDIKLKRQDDAEKLSLESMKALQDARLNAIVLYDNAQRDQIELDLQNDVITQDEHDNKILALDKVLAEARLDAAKEHARDIASFHYKSDKERVDAIEASNKEIEAADKDLSEVEKKILRKSIADKKEIEKEIKEIEKKYGINSYRDKRKEYEQDLKDLEEAHKKELVLYEKDAKKKAASVKRYESDIAKIKLTQAKKVAEDIAEITQAAGNLVAAIQETEMLAVDNKYAAELKAAKGNSDETTRIEEEIAAEKVKVQKKYADTNFAISVAQISANTAVAIMKALADLGPIAGPIAAGLIGLTGLAQIAVANEQRTAVQQLYTGGFTEPGDKYKPAGIVHAGEFVANQDAVRNTPMRKVFNLIDHAQKTNTVARITNEDIARVVGVRKGFSDGGYASAMQAAGTGGGSGISKEELAWAIQMAMQGNNSVITALLAEIQKGIKTDLSISGRNGVAQKLDEYNQLIKNAQG